MRVTGKVLESPKTASDPQQVSSSGGGGDDDGPSDVVLLAGAIGGIAVGLVGGGALAGVRRKRPA